MRTRNKKYSDYGMGSDEVDSLKAFCKSTDFDQHLLLMKCAVSVYAEIAPELYYSLARGLSYDCLSKKRFIPLSRTDFYGYQRKCLATFYNKLMNNNSEGDNDM